VRLTSPDKVLFPEQGWTKRDVAEHFALCWPGALRGVYDRPTLLKRWNDGVKGRPLFVKRPKSAPSLEPVTFPAAHPGNMFVPRTGAHIVWMAQQNCLDMNPWNCRSGDQLHPDELRLDFDPTPGVPFSDVCAVAGVARELLEELGLRGWPKTSGNRGIHVYIRVKPEWDVFQVRRCALALGRELERRTDLATTAWWKEERQGVFIDYNQNAWDKTIASAYSVRETGWVSAPFRWEELDHIEPAAFALDAFRARWQEVGDLTDGIDESAGDLTAVLAMVAEDERRGLGEAPWPPHYPKMPGEPPRVAPSRKKSDPQSS
jgi:DNA ligase D-like protein (predicted polymerase)